MSLRHFLTATAALAAATSLASAPASAQAFDPYNRWYQARGCDYAYASIFGSGPRLCATAIIGVSDLTHSLLVTQATIDAFTWYRSGLSDVDPGVGFSPGTLGIDGGLTQCRYLACIGSVTETFVEDAYTIPGYVPQYLTMTIRYYDGQTDHPDPGADPGRVSTFQLNAVVIPEPATLVLFASGLATLGAISRGAQRRHRTPAES